MIITQETEIAVEIEETIAYTGKGQRVEAFCTRCKALVTMVTPQIGALSTHLSEREIYRLIEIDQVHFIETAEGLVLVCQQSLSGFEPDARIRPADVSGAVEQPVGKNKSEE